MFITHPKGESTNIRHTLNLSVVTGIYLDENRPKTIQFFYHKDESIEWYLDNADEAKAVFEAINALIKPIDISSLVGGAKDLKPYSLEKEFDHETHSDLARRT
ncbi:hypothetical protein [Paraferrimonas sedimenticola]|uniref:Uncharacterized protein n=1 Tax=Paraferrimonas sedimenticola TaxID=375674 RepID=A0AA37RUY8_9GAMM|nr:hypothetical protein [Paraferrimonas sedimenticola]GLP95324.1 hypothetical protein GCM10007895_06300 [Paraferrimonas sedimenticola]